MLRIMGRETALTGKVITGASNMIECVIISKGWPVQIGLLDGDHDVASFYNYLKIMCWIIFWELLVFFIIMEHKAGSEYY